MGWLKSLLGGGVLGTIEKIASELIETDMESAEAKTLLIKAVDPNGLMRRQLSKFASRAYGFYLVSATVLIFVHAFSDPVAVGLMSSSKEAMDGITALFLPITGAWTAIVGASFGVNATNVIKEK